MTTAKTYRFSFYGRQSGAIGINYNIVDSYKAQSMSEAKSLLWADYEPLRLRSIKCNAKEIQKDVYDKAAFIEVRPNSERPRDKARATYLPDLSLLK